MRACSRQTPSPGGHRCRDVRLGIALVLGIAAVAVCGCGRPGVVDIDLTTSPVRFIVDHHGWPKPFWWPRVTEFAIGSDKDELLWHLETSRSTGEPADRLAFIYGQVPPGFRQLVPAGDAPPQPLKTGRTYYVAAVGPRAVYRMVFSLPQSPLEAGLMKPAAP